MKELALLELEFLWRVEWRIVPTPEVLEDYYRSLVERTEGFKISSGGRGSRSGSRGSQKSETKKERTAVEEAKGGSSNNVAIAVADDSSDSSNSDSSGSSMSVEGSSETGQVNRGP